MLRLALALLAIPCIVRLAAGGAAGGGRGTAAGRRGEMPKSKVHTNSIGMKLVRIEPGTFRMGSTRGDFDERPVHEVALTRPFHLAATEVTNAQYERFDPEHKKLRGKLGFSKRDDEAVVFVSWHEAVAFCRWLSQKEDLPYRLPTEAEWEYACRASTQTAYHTGDSLPKAFQKNARMSWFPGRRSGRDVVPLTVGRTPPNAWGLYDMHGNVEEWCGDWYGPYPKGRRTDPVGPEGGDFKVTRGGSHSTVPGYLRSANRLGTLPEDKSWLIGFRVALGEQAKTKPLPAAPAPLNRRNVKQDVPRDLAKGPDPRKPYFKGPRQYVKVPPNSEGPLFSRHNHDPAIVQCPNGDLLAIWYTCRREPGRELGIAASRLRYGSDQWEPASPFWDAPDRNDHAPAMWADEKGTIYHFNGLSAGATWGSLATILRTSKDSGATWSKARLIMAEHGLHHMPVESVIGMKDGTILLPCDAVPGGKGGTAVLLSKDDGQTWTDPAEGKPIARFAEGAKGATIAGIHAGVVQLKDGRLMAFGRGNNIDGRMPKSVSTDGGRTWTYRASEFPPISGGQRLILTRLREGPIVFCSFARRMSIRDASGDERAVSGLFAALSFDEGQTWPVRKLVSDYGPRRRVDGGGNTGWFVMSDRSAEPRGYLSVCQTPDGVIQLITSKQHYAFNLAWLKEPMPPAAKAATAKAQDLPAKAKLATVFAPKDLPSKAEAWRYNGSGVAEARAVSFPKGGGMKIDTGGRQRCRWFDDSSGGFGGVKASAGFTAEIRLQVLKSAPGRRGIDFEASIRSPVPRRYLVSITASGVYWYAADGPLALADKLDNAAAAHTFRLAVRADGVVQVYRDGRLLGARRPASATDRLTPAKRSYLQWGEGAGASEADAVVYRVAYDLTGAYAPAKAR